MTPDTQRVAVPIIMVKAVADAILAALADYPDAPEVVRIGAIMAGGQAACDAVVGVKGMTQ